MGQQEQSLQPHGFIQNIAKMEYLYSEVILLVGGSARVSYPTSHLTFDLGTRGCLSDKNRPR